jgi:predicted nucleic acid-binding protein
MMAFVLDCSVAMSWCFEDQANDYAKWVLDSLLKNTAVAPAIWSYEVANVLISAERRKKIAPAASVRFLDLLAKLPITLFEESHLKLREAIHSVGQSYHLSAYDAAYLCLSMSRGLPLATLDGELRNACKRSGVKIFMAME